MDPSKKLLSEINGNIIEETDKIIANPNCSTIQMLMILAPIHKIWHKKSYCFNLSIHWNRVKV